MATRKIDLMHNMFGINAIHFCCECCNFTENRYHDKKYFKCEVYGDTSSEATDWRKGYIACGHFGRRAEENTRPMVKMVQPERALEVLDGQIGLFERSDT